MRRRSIPHGVEVYEINGPFFFGAVGRFRERVSAVEGRPKVLIIRLRNVPAIDSTGLHASRELVHRSRRDGVRVIIADAHAQPLVALAQRRVVTRITPPA